MTESMIKKVGLFDIINYVFMIILAIICIFPVYYVFIISFASYEDLQKVPVYIYPVSFNLDAYNIIFKSEYFFNSILISIFVTITGTCLSMVISILAGYALSKKNLFGGKFMMLMVLFTMFFNSGLIPYFLTVKATGLKDNILVLIVPMAVNTIYLILIKNYFATIPPSLEESAKIDGANDLYILWKVILPTCAPILATISLFYAVDRWNEWFHAALFISSKKYHPIQMVLREALFNYDMAMSGNVGRAIALSKKVIYGRSLQMAVVLLSMIPILCVYPFLQKHFTKGILLGAVKE